MKLQINHFNFECVGAFLSNLILLVLLVLFTSVTAHAEGNSASDDEQSPTFVSKLLCE